jgi:hypothetical protein
MKSRYDRRCSDGDLLPWREVNSEPRWIGFRQSTGSGALDWDWTMFSNHLKSQLSQTEGYQMFNCVLSWASSFPGQYGKDLLLSSSAYDAIAHFNCAIEGQNNKPHTEQNRRSRMRRLKTEYEVYKSQQIQVDVKSQTWKPIRLFDLSNPSDTTWGKENRRLVNLPYYLAKPPSKFMESLEPFLHWRSEQSSGLVRLELLDGTFVELVAASAWTSQKGQAAFTSSGRKMFLEFSRSFGGFATLPSDASDERLRGLGIPLKDLNVGHLMEAENVCKFFDFKRNRRGQSTGQVDMDFLRWNMLMNPKNGYLRFAQRLSWSYLHKLLEEKTPQTPSEWNQYCDEQVRIVQQKHTLLHRGKSVRSRRRQGRSASTTLKTLFTYDRPLAEVIWPTILYLEDKILQESVTPRRRFAHHYRIFLMVVFVLVTLRASNWINMLWGKNLFLKDGRWKIYLEVGEFKNRRALNEDYLIDVGDEGQDYFSNHYDLWKEVFGYDPLLPKYRQRESFVLANMCSITTVTGNPEPQQFTIAAITYRLRFLEKVWNLHIGPHAFRHIRATDWEKRFPGDFSTIAGFLNDSEETVRKHYGHANSSDYHKAVVVADKDIKVQARKHLSLIYQNKSLT